MGCRCRFDDVGYHLGIMEHGAACAGTTGLTGDVLVKRRHANRPSSQMLSAAVSRQAAAWVTWCTTGTGETTLHVSSVCVAASRNESTVAPQVKRSQSWTLNRSIWWNTDMSVPEIIMTNYCTSTCRPVDMNRKFRGSPFWTRTLLCCPQHQ
jgi:hypothetical protein